MRGTPGLVARPSLDTMSGKVGLADFHPNVSKLNLCAAPAKAYIRCQPARRRPGVQDRDPKETRHERHHGLAARGSGHRRERTRPQHLCGATGCLRPAALSRGRRTPGMAEVAETADPALP